MEDKKIASLMGGIIISGALAAAAFYLLGVDAVSLLIWWVTIWMLGCTFMPVASLLFPQFMDRGWMFSKVLGIAISGYLTWLVVVLKIFPFTTLTCMGVTLFCMVANLWIALRLRRGDVEIWPERQGKLIFTEEAIFFLVFLLWTYVAGFHPAAHGTEKFMDFGFMQSMMKSTTLPAVDMWYSQEPFNYYYGGQYFAVFLTKLTTTTVEITYNLMRTMIAAFAFVLPFSLVYQMLRDRMRGEGRRRPGWIAGIGGLLAGAAVSLSSNMHYVIYRWIIPLIYRAQGKAEIDRYWFPNATRYIGHDPENLDRTIHEFPSYSFVLGDLHAHVVNIFFVMMVVAALYGWLQYNKGKSWRQLTVIVCGIFLGIFQFSNTWDFAIYYVVICGTLFFGNLKRYHERMRYGIGWSIIQWMEVLLISMVVALPFNLNFDSSMAQGVAIAQNHSEFYQWCVLWAFPVLVCGSYILWYLWGMSRIRFGKFFQKTQVAGMYTVILSMCAIGLIIIPELVYVRDIYEETSARSNTMFKLTYQAYILFGMAMSYVLIRYVTARRKYVLQIFGVLMTCVLLSTFGYIGNATMSWFGNIFDRNGYETLDATLYMENEIPEDAGAIRWLEANVGGRPVVLEANGNSYEDYNNRVSAMTGFPTVLGWYVHEWLWRNNTADLNEKAEQIAMIYTSTDKDKVEELLREFNVSYIFIGSCEREKYPEMNESFLKTLGEVVYDDNAIVVEVN